jgi:hypothetical protein
MAKLYEEMALACLDSEQSESSLVKGEQAYLNALSLFQQIPGMSGLKYDVYVRAEVGSRIMKRQNRTDDLMQLMVNTRTFVEKNRLEAPLMENSELRVEVSRLQYAHVQTEG